MSYLEGRAALQLVAEREVGVPMRQAIEDENAREDASIARLRKEAARGPVR